MSKFEKVFIIISSVIICFTIGIYGWRLNHYYKIYGLVEEAETSLYNHILNSNDNLYNKNNTYYFHGNVDNNYVLFSGKLWRIINLHDGEIKLITDEDITTLAFGETYKNSYVRKWLNPSEEEHSGIFYHSINTDYINSINVCVNKISSGDITCDETEEDLIGLLSVEDFNLVGGINSYLNNGNNWWLSNSSENGNWYATSDGINSSESNYQSYGVRPVILLNNDIPMLSGNGTINDPYIIEQREVKALGDTYPGEYVTYNNYNFRVISINDESVTLKLNDILKKAIFSNKNNEFDTNNKSSIAYYLNNNFYKSLGSDVLLSKFYNGTYTDNYDYAASYSDTIEAYVGLPSIGSMFNSKYNGIYLINKSINEKSIYTISDTYNIYADDITEELGIIPIINLPKNLNIISGDSYNTPYVVGGAVNEE